MCEVNVAIDCASSITILIGDVLPTPNPLNNSTLEFSIIEFQVSARQGNECCFTAMKLIRIGVDLKIQNQRCFLLCISL